METMSRSFKRGTSACHRAGEGILGADSAPSAPKRAGNGIAIFQPERLENKQLANRSSGTLFRLIDSGYGISRDRFRPRFSRRSPPNPVSHHAKCFQAYGPPISAESGNLPASRGHRIAFQEERHAIE
jgi:hypothetical protein